MWIILSSNTGGVDTVKVRVRMMLKPTRLMHRKDRPRARAPVPPGNPGPRSRDQTFRTKLESQVELASIPAVLGACTDVVRGGLHQLADKRMPSLESVETTPCFSSRLSQLLPTLSNLLDTIVITAWHTLLLSLPVSHYSHTHARLGPDSS